MASRNFYPAALILALFLTAFSYAQNATCSGWKTFKVANEFNTSPYGINKFGTVVGGTLGGYNSTNPAPAFIRYSNGSLTTYNYQHLHTVFTRRNGLGVTVGYYEDTASHLHGIVVSGSKVVTINYPNASDTAPLGINDAGVIVGYYLLRGSPNTHGFEYKNGKFYAIQYPNGVQTVVQSVNNKNVMVGGEWTGSGKYEGFILKNGTFTKFKDPKATGATFVYDINDSGTIVGDYIVGVYTQSFIYINGAFKDIVVPNAAQANTSGINIYNDVTGEAFVHSGASSGFIAHCQ